MATHEVVARIQRIDGVVDHCPFGRGRRQGREDLPLTILRRTLGSDY